MLRVDHGVDLDYFSALERLDGIPVDVGGAVHVAPFIIGLLRSVCMRTGAAEGRAVER